jgi:hypothetical protein
MAAPAATKQWSWALRESRGRSPRPEGPSAGSERSEGGPRRQRWGM